MGHRDEMSGQRERGRRGSSAPQKLTAGGKPVLLDTAKRLTNGVPPGQRQVQNADQTKVTTSKCCYRNGGRKFQSKTTPTVDPRCVRVTNLASQIRLSPITMR
jgi:hypothetical protein